jgi:xylulokinase
VTIELYHTDGAAGAAKGAGIGTGLYSSPQEAFASLEKLAVIEPDKGKKSQYRDAYRQWRSLVTKD